MPDRVISKSIAFLKARSNFVVDLDNDMTSVVLDEHGRTKTAIPLGTVVRAFYGTKNVIGNCTVTAVSEDPDINVTYNSTNNTINIDISANTDLYDTTTITITVVHASYGTRTTTFTIAAVKEGDGAFIQELLPSLSDISFKRTTAGALDPASRTLSLSIKKTDGSTTEEQTISDSNLYVRWSTSSMPSSSDAGTAWGSGTVTGITWSSGSMVIDNSVDVSNIYIAAFKTDNTLVDMETIPVIKDGEHGDAAPYYFQEWFAWSNVESTVNATTSPFGNNTEPNPAWNTSIPENTGGLAYLWRKSVRYVWDSNNRSYSAETAQYFRMSGTNGTSISVKGTVATVADLSNITNPQDGDAYVVSANGHLYMWSSEASNWIDLGQFKGDNGVTYYTHIAWATNVNYNSSGVVTRVDGFTIDKSPNDTTHLWMGVLVNEDSSTDSSAALDYTWSYTKGVDGFSVQAQYAPNNNPSSSQIHNTWQNGDIYMRTKQSNETNWSSWNKIVGESGGETDYQFALSANLVTQDGTSATAPSDISSSDWQDAPMSTITQKPYLWSKVQKKDGNGNNVGNPSYIRLTGEKGENAFVVDLENEMTNVALDENGNLTANFDMYFKVRAYYGTTNVLSDSACSVSASCSNPDVTITDTNAKTTGIRVQVAQNVALANSTNITVTVTHTTYGTRTVIFTLAGVRGGENAVLQELLPSLDTISFARTAAGGLTPSSRDLTLSIKKTQGGSTSTQSISDSGLTIRWSSTSMPASKTVGNVWGNGTATGISWNSTTMKIANTVEATNIYIAAFNSAGTLVDRETIPVIKDGNNGADGHDGQDGNDGQNAIAVDLDNEHEDFIYDDGGNNRTGTVTCQARLYDGGTQVVFDGSNISWMISDDNSSWGQSTSTNSTASIVNETTNNGLLTITGIKANTVKIRVRALYKSNYYYASFTANKINSDKYDIVLKPNSVSYNSANYQTQRITPSATRMDLQGNKYNVTISTSVAAGNVCLFYGLVSASGSVGTMAIVNAAYLDITSAIASANNGVYFELRKYTSSSVYRVCDYDTVPITKAKNGSDGLDGKDGKDGADGNDGEDALTLALDTYAIAFPTDSDYNVESALTYTVGVKMFLGNDTQQTITSISHTSSDSGVTVSSISNGVRIEVGEETFVNPVTVTVTAVCSVGSRTAKIILTAAPKGAKGNKGNDGERGKVGRFFYFGGTFDSSNTTQTFIVNDAQAPYFEHTVNGQKRYHVFNYDTNGTYTMSQMWAISSNWNNKPWEVMTNDFKYLITEALFTDFAKLGSGVFNKDWLLSAYGKREKVLKSSSSSINQGTNYNYIKVPNMTSIDVIEGNIYSFYITWYSVSGYSLLARVAISTDGGSNYDTTEEFYATGDSTSHVDVLSFRARFTGKATLFYCGSGTITKVVTYDDSTISGTNTGYRKFTPSFPNTDYVHINASNAGQGIGNTTYSYVSLSKFTVVQGMTYKLQMDGIIQSGSGTCYVSVYKYSDNTPINLYGAENTEGVYYRTTTDGGYYRMYFDSNYTRITKAASFTPNFSGEIVVMGRISSSGIVGNLQNMILIPVNPFVPKVAIDWLSGYAHFGGDSVHFNPNGSGWLANKNITWNEGGDAEFTGKVTATSGEFTGKVTANSGKIAGDLDVTGGFNVKSGTTTVVAINGREGSTGSSNGNITILDAKGLYIKRESEGFRLTTNGGFQRWNSTANSWVNFYGGRYVRTVTSFNYTILLNDDLIIAKPFSSEKRAYLPKLNVPDGKIITIINAGAYGLLVNGNGHNIIGASVYTEVALNINDRMEFIYSKDSSNDNNSKWYANFMPKVDNDS